MPVAAETDGLTVGEQPFTGEVRLRTDPGPAGRARVAYGEWRLVVLVREGVWGVRDYAPESFARRAFRGLRVTPYAPRRVVPGRFTPHDAGARTVRVPNADGGERGLGLGGELAFELDGRGLSGQVTVEQNGSPWAVLADATSGNGSFRFRFPRPAHRTPRGARRSTSAGRCCRRASSLPPLSAPFRRRGTPWMSQLPPESAHSGDGCVPRGCTRRSFKG